MAHPLLFSPEDPLVDAVRRIAMRYPEADEKLSWGRPHFRAGSRVFVFVGAQMTRPDTLVFKPDQESRLVYDEDPRFFVPPYWGAAGWRALELRLDGSDWDEVAELIDASYRLVALKRQIAALDANPVLPAQEAGDGGS